MIKGGTIFIFFLILITSCKSSKVSYEKSTNLSANKLIQKHYDVAFNNINFKANASIKYSGKAELPNLKASIRIIKDSIIWVSVSKFSIPLAKIVITPSQIQFYEKLSKSYFIGDFKLIRDWIGVELDFSKVQNLFIGEALLNLNEEKYEIDFQENMYILKPKKHNPLFEIFFWIDPSNYKLKKEELKHHDNDQFLSINYRDYVEKDNSLFPKGFYIDAHDKINHTSIDVSYRNVIFDTPLRFPFKIPNGYKEIELR